MNHDERMKTRVSRCSLARILKSFTIGLVSVPYIISYFRVSELKTATTPQGMRSVSTSSTTTTTTAKVRQTLQR
jgi:hypothetical protein